MMTIVWQRPFDKAAAAKRWRRFTYWFVVPVIGFLGLMLALQGFYEFLGALILTGGLILLFGGALWVHDYSIRSAKIVREGNELVAMIRVQIDQVAHWTTYILTIEEQLQDWNLQRRLMTTYGVAMFTYRDGSERKFMWPKLTDEELEGVREALTPQLSAPWTPRQ